MTISAGPGTWLNAAVTMPMDSAGTPDL